MAGLGQATQDALKGPDYPMLQGLFLLFSARDHPDQPRHRPRLRLPRPEGEHAVTDPTGGAFESARDSALAEAMAPLPPEGGSRRSLTWNRRRKSAGEVWREFWASGQGKAGLIILVFFVAMALLAPLISSSDGLKVTNALGNKQNAAPTLGVSVRHRQRRAQRPHALRLGRTHQPVRGHRRHARRDRHRIVRRDHRRLRRWADRRAS